MSLGHLMLVAILLGTTASACQPGAVDSRPRPTAADVRHDYDSGVRFVDVRSDQEWSVGHLRSAVHLPVDTIAGTAASVLPDKDAPLVTYCHSGARAQTAAETLRALGYTNVTAMAGGYRELKAAGFPVDEPH